MAKSSNHSAIHLYFKALVLNAELYGEPICGGEIAFVTNGKGCSVCIMWNLKSGTYSSKVAEFSEKNGSGPNFNRLPFPCVAELYFSIDGTVSSKKSEVLLYKSVESYERMHAALENEIDGKGSWVSETGYKVFFRHKRDALTCDSQESLLPGSIRVDDEVAPRC